MAAALYTDIKKYREQSTFIKPREGLFGLRDWNQEGCDILVRHRSWLLGQKSQNVSHIYSEMNMQKGMFCGCSSLMGQD